MSKTDELWPGGYTITFDERAFLPGTDAFLLGAFPAVARGERVCDLGAGGGILGLLLLARQPGCRVWGLELQEEACTLAIENIKANALEDKLSVQCGDLRRCRDFFRPGSFDRVVTNPPYFKQHSGAQAATAARQTAREETGCTLEELCAAASDMLRWGGTFDIVFRPERLGELLCAMTGARLEPKRLRWVQERVGRTPSLILAEGKKGAHPGMVTEAPLLLHEADGSDTQEMAHIYFKDREA
jgi:tRNA1Val (adenine37-N6)-methyltransferase